MPLSEAKLDELLGSLFDGMTTVRRLRRELDTCICDGNFEIADANREGRLHFLNYTYRSVCDRDGLRAATRVMTLPSPSSGSSSSEAVGAPAAPVLSVIDLETTLVAVSSETPESDSDTDAGEGDAGGPRLRGKAMGGSKSGSGSAKAAASAPAKIAFDSLEARLKWAGSQPNEPLARGAECFAAAARKAAELANAETRVRAVLAVLEQAGVALGAGTAGGKAAVAEPETSGASSAAAGHAEEAGPAGVASAPSEWILVDK